MIRDGCGGDICGDLRHLRLHSTSYFTPIQYSPSLFECPHDALNLDDETRHTKEVGARLQMLA
jgi:hypothetical protein